jgi:hypothetical protein
MPGFDHVIFPGIFGIDHDFESGTCAHVRSDIFQDPGRIGTVVYHSPGKHKIIGFHGNKFREMLGIAHIESSGIPIYIESPTSEIHAGIAEFYSGILCTGPGKSESHGSDPRSDLQDFFSFPSIKLAKTEYVWFGSEFFGFDFVVVFHCAEFSIAVPYVAGSGIPEIFHVIDIKRVHYGCFESCLLGSYSELSILAQGS